MRRVRSVVLLPLWGVLGHRCLSLIVGEQIRCTPVALTIRVDTGDCPAPARHLLFTGGLRHDFVQDRPLALTAA